MTDPDTQARALADWLAQGTNRPAMPPPSEPPVDPRDMPFNDPRDANGDVPF